jgi:hypothetical protein
MKLPKSLATKCNEMAEEFGIQVAKNFHDRSPSTIAFGIPAADFNNKPDFNTLCAFKDGFQACYDLLLSMGPEFDENGASVRAGGDFVDHFPAGDESFAAITGFIAGARYQHSLVSLQLAAKDSMIAELEEELRKAKE